MGSLVDMIKNESKGVIDNTDVLIIEQVLNKLFYASTNPKEELEMLKMQFRQKQGDRYGLHASSLLASEEIFCYREQILSLFYKQAQGENIKIGLKRIFEEGNFIGEKWQRLFIRGGIGVKEDMDISRFIPEYDLSYTPDAKVVIAKKKWIVETKSQNTFLFKKQTGHPSGMKQLKLYMFLEQVENGFVLVEDKNSQEFKILPAKNKEEDLDYIIERLERIQVYKKQFKKLKKPPERICEQDSCKRALTCNMRGACFNIGMGRVKLCV